jgi:hypothetical protein
VVFLSVPSFFRPFLLLRSNDLTFGRDYEQKG